MCSYTTAAWFPPHLSTGHLAHKRREAADKSAQTVVPDLSSSHREEIAELVTSHFFPPTFLGHLSSQASKSIVSILKCHLHCDEEHCLCAVKTDKKRSKSGSQNIKILHCQPHWASLGILCYPGRPPELTFARQPQGSRACSFGKGY